MTKLYAGHATVDISGRAPIRYYGGVSRGVHDPLYIHCLALSDGKETALLMSLDLKKMISPAGENTLAIIEKEFGIPASHVILSCTHTHSAPDAGATSEGNPAWLEQYYEKVPMVIRAALADMDEVTEAFAGKSLMEKGVTFVRRYLLPDGTYKMNAGKKDNVVCHESEADPEMRSLRLLRKNKKTLVLVNFQTHYGGATALYPQLFSADFVAPFTRAMEKDLNCIFVYYSGAGGNINFNSPIPGEKKYPDYRQAIPAFVAAAKRAIAAEEKISPGPIRARLSRVQQAVRRDTEERVARAKRVQAAGYDRTEEGKALMGELGFGNKYDASFTLYRLSLPDMLSVPLNAITFGDVAFCGAPYEMFDQSAVEIREASPCKTTFVCTINGNHFGYMPHDLAFSHGAYETYACLFERGAAERFAGELVSLVKACKEEK